MRCPIPNTILDLCFARQVAIVVTVVVTVAQTVASATALGNVAGCRRCVPGDRRSV